MTAAIDPTEVERRLIAAFDDARSAVVEHPDLFARVQRSIEEAEARRRFRARLAIGIAAFVIVNVVVALSLSDVRNGRLIMPWWVIELVTNVVLVALAVALGPFIKRFGRAYAADVFRDNPRTGKSYLVLTDVAYYLIFAAFVLFTVRFVEADSWKESRGDLLQHELARVGGILLIMGVLHAANVVALPVIGQLLSSGRPQLGRSTGGHDRVGPPGVGPGTWLLRIEPAGDPDDRPTGEADSPWSREAPPTGA